MEPHRIRVLVVAVLAVIIFVLHTVAFSTTSYSKVDFKYVKNKFVISCVHSRYGLFRKCEKPCVLLDSSEQCSSIDYKHVIGGSGDDDVTAFVALAIMSYVLTFASVVGFVIPVIKTIPTRVRYVAIFGLATAGVIGIAGSVLYTRKIFNAWSNVKVDNDQLSFSYSKTVSSSTGWSFSLSLISDIIKIILSIASCCILRKYPADNENLLGN